MYCTVELHIPRKTPAVLVPADALVFNSEGCRWRWTTMAARLPKVTVARDLGTEVEVGTASSRATR